jgi:hypothetical protein
MKNSLNRIVLILAGAVLAACNTNVLYGRADEPSIVLTQPLGQTIPGDPTQTPVTLPPGFVTFTFGVPNIPLSGGSTTSNQAGFTIASTMKLNQAAMTITSPATGADFNKIDTLTLTIQSGSRSQVLATYTKDPARPPPDKTIVLQRTEDVELLDYLTAGTGGNTVSLSISGSGTLPQNNWTADVDLDLHVRATAAWP